jgi:hypothetical protein
MKVIGKWTIQKGGDILVTIPGARSVGNKKYPYKSKYLNDIENPIDIKDIERDIVKEIKVIVRLTKTSMRGGKIETL